MQRKISLEEIAADFRDAEEIGKKAFELNRPDDFAAANGLFLKAFRDCPEGIIVDGVGEGHDLKALIALRYAQWLENIGENVQFVHYEDLAELEGDEPKLEEDKLPLSSQVVSYLFGYAMEKIRKGELYNEAIAGWQREAKKDAEVKAKLYSADPFGRDKDLDLERAAQIAKSKEHNFEFKEANALYIKVINKMDKKKGPDEVEKKWLNIAAAMGSPDAKVMVKIEHIRRLVESNMYSKDNLKNEMGDIVKFLMKAKPNTPGANAMIKMLQHSEIRHAVRDYIIENKLASEAMAKDEKGSDNLLMHWLKQSVGWGVPPWKDGTDSFLQIRDAAKLEVKEKLEAKENKTDAAPNPVRTTVIFGPQGSVKGDGGLGLGLDIGSIPYASSEIKLSSEARKFIDEHLPPADWGRVDIQNLEKLKVDDIDFINREVGRILKVSAGEQLAQIPVLMGIIVDMIKNPEAKPPSP